MVQAMASIFEVIFFARRTPCRLGVRRIAPLVVCGEWLTSGVPNDLATRQSRPQFFLGTMVPQRTMTFAAKSNLLVGI
jgi:hypothetical protein